MLPLGREWALTGRKISRPYARRLFADVCTWPTIRGCLHDAIGRMSMHDVGAKNLSPAPGYKGAGKEFV
jgi:hypothetical protein